MFLLIKRKQLLTGLMVMAMAITGILGLSLARAAPRVATTAASGNWGLSFPKKGEPPVGNASPEQLAAYNAYYMGNTGEKRLYLTFDAGYENGYTATILDVLKKHRVPAAFFVVGHYLESAPDLVRRMAEEGHLVGNHTYHHPDMSGIAEPVIFRQELELVEEAYRKLTGKEMSKIYRPPQGKYSQQNLKLAKEAGYTTYFWSLAYVDWYVDKQPTHQQAFDKLLGRVHNGAIVLLHSTSATNCEILDELLTKWKDMGYTFGSLTELAAQKPSG